MVILFSVTVFLEGADPPKLDASFFNGKNLTGWKGNAGYWSVQEGAIVGHADKRVGKNEFIWSQVEVKDFYLAVDVKLTPGNRNAGIQFRSKSINKHGQALGYQADMGAGVWGKLYHEHGRGKLDWNNRAAGAVKQRDWNRYEILAVGHRIWTAINGKLCVAIEDSKGELSGKISFQIHSGPPQTVHYKVVKLVHNPKMTFAGLTQEQLLAALPKKPVATKQPANAKQPKPGWTPQVVAWRKKLDANDPGMGKAAWFAQDYKDADWKSMSLPGHYEGKGLGPYDGTVWFRRTVEMPEKSAGKKLLLELGPIDDMDMTWFNGTQVGGIERPGFWAAPRKYSVPGKLVKAGNNVITVRVLDHGFSGGFAGNAGQMKLTGAGVKLSLSGPWRYKPGVTLKALGLGELTNPGSGPVAKTPAPPKSAVATLLRPLIRPKTPVAPFADGFNITTDQTLVLMGSTNALATSRNGYLETLLTAAWPKHQLRFRNMAWQADTVYQQQRPRNFHAVNKPNYGERDARQKTSADIVFFWMGQAESLGGGKKIDEFTTAYSKHLDQIGLYTNRIVLITPVPISDPLGFGLDVEERNEKLAAYVKAIKQIAIQKKLPVVDLFGAFQSKDSPKVYSHNGIHLTPAGHWFAAEAAAKQLGFADRVATMRQEEQNSTLGPPSTESLRQAIGQKNTLWFRYWRPTNWAFLYGNRQTQPSSRQHTNRRIRWFPSELEATLPRIGELESQIQKLSLKANQK
jgi:hypothetical protein